MRVFPRSDGDLTRTRRPRVILGIWLALLLGLLLDIQAAQAAGRDGGKAETDGAWLPGIGLLLAVDSQVGDARAVSSARGEIDGDGTLLTPLIGLDAEIQTPTLTSRLGRPRLFIRGGVTRAFDAERIIVKEGAPGAIDIPFIDPDMDGISVQEPPIDSIGGRGTRFETQVQPWGFMAGVGLAFEVPSLSDRARKVRIRPSIEYRRERLQAAIFLGAAQSIDNSETCPCRSTSFKVTEKQTLHAIGPAVEVEMDLNSLRSMIVTIYGAFHAYRVIDGRSLNVGGEGVFDDGTPVSLEGNFERDLWSYRFGLGLRFRWNPS